MTKLIRKYKTTINGHLAEVKVYETSAWGLRLDFSNSSTPAFPKSRAVRIGAARDVRIMHGRK